MIRTLAITLCATALTACSPAPRAQPDASAPGAAAAALPTAITQIEGPWDILSFDGHRPARLDTDGQRHAFVDVQGDDVRFAIECNYTGMRANIEGGRLAALPSDQIQTEMGCGPDREGRDEAFFAFMRTGPAIAGFSEGAMTLENKGVRLELQRPDIRRAPLLPTQLSELEGAWRADIIYLRPDPGRTDNLLAELSGAPARFNISSGQIRLTYDCETVTAAVHLTAPGALRAREGGPQRARRGACSVSDANRDQVASLLASEVIAENIPPSGLLLEAGNVYAVLRRD